MQQELEQIIKDYNLEGTRIQVGRQRIYPQREGLNATPDQLDSLKSLLAGHSVKGTLRITAGEVVIAANSGGAIDQAFNPGLLPNPPQSSEVNLMQRTQTPTVKPTNESPIEPDTAVKEPAPEVAVAESQSVAPVIESAAEAPALQQRQTQTPQQTYLDLLKQSPEFKGGDVSYDDLLKQPLEDLKPLDAMVIKTAEQNNLSRDEAETIIGAASPFIEKSVDAIQAAVEQLVSPEFVTAAAQTQAENQAAPDAPWEPTPRDHYIWLSDSFYNDTMFPGDDYSDLFEKALEQPERGRQNDTQVVLAAFRLDQTPEQLQEVLTQSPYVQSQVAKGVALSEMQQQYVAPIVAYYSEFYQEKVAQGAPEENLRQALEQVGKPQAQVTSTPEGATASAVPASDKQFDYPNTAHSIDPAKDFRDTVQHGAATLHTQAIAAKETLELAQKNLTTFANHVKHRGLKAWAKDQLPLLQNRTMKLMQTQAAKVGEYVREQAPVLRDATIAGAKQVGQSVAQYAKEQAPVIGTKAQAIGEQVSAKFTALTQRVDPAQIERLGTLVLSLSQDEPFTGNFFDFKKGETGIDISLKNGTPVFRDGKLNPKLDTSYAIRLSQMAEQMDAIKPQTPAQNNDRKKAVAR